MYKNKGGVWRVTLGVSQSEDKSGGTAVITSVSFARWQQGDQAVTGRGVVF